MQPPPPLNNLVNSIKFFEWESEPLKVWVIAPSQRINESSCNRVLSRAGCSGQVVVNGGNSQAGWPGKHLAGTSQLVSPLLV